MQIYLWVQHCKFQHPGYYDSGAVTLKLYNTHTVKSLVGISPIEMELLFSEYI